ncbi:S1 family peptidase [Geodermatophilus sp. URMC 61]|uniref:S1 family peptidase n=1 Tax=Geodermatophilus sp. URMC 61 TaxID=3423411 RepID=UPI00406CA3AA
MTDRHEARAHRGRRAAAVLMTGIACTGMLLASPGTAAAAEVSDAEKSIVLVGVSWEGYVLHPDATGAPVWSAPVNVMSGCTGWFAAEDGHIVTAGHCVDPAEGRAAILQQFLVDNNMQDRAAEAFANWPVEGLEQGSDPVRVVQVVQPPAVEGAVITDPITVQVVDHQPFADGDLALLKANGLPEATPALAIAEEPAAIGDPITSIGFPDTVAAVTDVSRLRASFKSGTVSSSQVSPDGVAGTEVNAELSYGMSGGPTINERGEVLGVNSFITLGDATNFNFITDATALRTYLERLDVELVPTSSAPAPSTGTTPASRTDEKGLFEKIPVWAYAVAGAGLVLVVGLSMVAMALRRRPARHAPSAPAAAFAAQAGTPAGEPCAHEGNSFGARFCQGCGRPIAEPVG